MVFLLLSPSIPHEGWAVTSISLPTWSSLLIHVCVNQSPAMNRRGASASLQSLSSLELYPAIFSHFVLPRHSVVSATQGIHWLQLGSRSLLSGLEHSQGSELGQWQSSFIFCYLSEIAVFHSLPSIALKTAASYISYASFLLFQVEVVG